MRCPSAADSWLFNATPPIFAHRLAQGHARRADSLSLQINCWDRLMAAIKRALGRLPWLTNSARLQELESLYAAINESQAVMELDMDGTVLVANDTYLKMFGYTLEEIVGQS